MKFPLGAMAPPGMEWQAGKTAASIRFVNDIERLDKSALDPEKITLLEAVAEKIRTGEVVLQEFLEVSDFLDRGFDP